MKRTPGKARSMNGFFFEPWLLKELNKQQYPTFVSDVHLEECSEAYHLSIEVTGVHIGDCHIEVELPYLHIRVQQWESRHSLFDPCYTPPLIRLFVRHLLLPDNVDIHRIVSNLSGNYLSVFLPKYFPD